jgi:hypothetical protein
MEISNKTFNTIREKAEIDYKNIESVFCPYLKLEVAFNSKGLEHIKFKDRNKSRIREDQYIRLKCLILSPRIIEESHTLQGYQQRNEFVEIKEKKWTHKLKTVNYFEFIAVIRRETRVRVIVREIEGGKPHFWSIIPFWKVDNSGIKHIHNGKPHVD